MKKNMICLMGVIITSSCCFGMFRRYAASAGIMCRIPLAQPMHRVELPDCVHVAPSSSEQLPNKSMMQKFLDYLLCRRTKQYDSIPTDMPPDAAKPRRRVQGSGNPAVDVW